MCLEFGPDRLRCLDDFDPNAPGLAEPRRNPTPADRNVVLERLWTVEAAARAVAAVDFPGRAIGERFRLKEALRLLDEALRPPSGWNRSSAGG